MKQLKQVHRTLRRIHLRSHRHVRTHVAPVVKQLTEDPVGSVVDVATTVVDAHGVLPPGTASVTLMGCKKVSKHVSDNIHAFATTQTAIISNYSARAWKLALCKERTLEQKFRRASEVAGDTLKAIPQQIRNFSPFGEKECN